VTPDVGALTREGLARARAAGVRLGRPPQLPDHVISTITAASADGRTLSGIAADLNAAGVPTAHGGAKWHASTVSGVLRSQAARRSAST
jgi:hypothetical protein